MAAQIQIQKLEATKFRVRVTDAGGSTTHNVTLEPKDHARLAGPSITAEELIRRSFEFLLEREPQESILSAFDLMLIARYFSEYEREIKRRLAQK
jgi:hypothetical protein